MNVQLRFKEIYITESQNSQCSLSIQKVGVQCHHIWHGYKSRVRISASLFVDPQEFSRCNKADNRVT